MSHALIAVAGLALLAGVLLISGVGLFAGAAFSRQLDGNRQARSSSAVLDRDLERLTREFAEGHADIGSFERRVEDVLRYGGAEAAIEADLAKRAVDRMSHAIRLQGCGTASVQGITVTSASTPPIIVDQQDVLVTNSVNVRVDEGRTVLVAGSEDVVIQHARRVFVVGSTDVTVHSCQINHLVANSVAKVDGNVFH